MKVSDIVSEGELGGRRIDPPSDKNTIWVVNAGSTSLDFRMSDGDPLYPTKTGREVDAAYANEPDNLNNKIGYIKGQDGKLYMSLNTGHAWKIGPEAWKKILGINSMNRGLPGAQHLPGDTTKKYAPPQTLPGQMRTGGPSFKDAQHLEESTDLSRIMMLSGLNAKR